MIIVDVEFVAIDRCYDFKLDDTVSISKIIDDMCEIISQKEGYESVKDPRKLILCNRSKGQILSQSATLQSYGVASGDLLMLV